MPKVPERQLSYGENLNKMRKLGNRHISSIPVIEDSQSPDQPGHIKVTKLPHPLKCSKCDYIAKNVADSKLHWLEH